MLLLSRRFAPLFWCQFFSAFNDNFLRTTLVFFILFGRDQADTSLITLASAVFISPYFFLSALGGEIADRYDKARVAQRLKLAEIAVAAVAISGFATQSIAVLFVALFGFGVIAALFGPIKYGILPDHLPREKLPAGNALIEGATFIAILSGTIVGGLAAKDGGEPTWLSVMILGFALVCWLSSLAIPPTGSGAPGLVIQANIAASTMQLIRTTRADARLWWGALVTSWFWLIGIVMLALLPPLVKDATGGNEETVTVYLVLFSIAVGGGSALAALIARGRIVLNTTLAGAVLLAIFALDLGLAGLTAVPPTAAAGPADVFATPLGLRLAVDLAALAAAGGLYIVPVFSAVQVWAGPEFRARVIAAVNLVNAAAMTGATIAVAVLQKAGVTLPVLLLMLGAAGLVIAAAIWRTMPKAR